MNSSEFVNRLKDAAKRKTLYIMGCFGAPMNERNKKRYSTNNAYNKKPERAAMIAAATPDTFGFDCVCLLKGILWGWLADTTKVYGGATYESNGVPDLGADQFFNTCAEISTDFSSILPGEAVWMSGHIGAYIGNGLVVESSPKWANGVQITACNKAIVGYNRRTWTKHGKLPYVEYEPQKTDVFKPGDLVEITGTTYYSGKNIPAWVKGKKWIVLSVKDDRVVIDRSEDGKNSICSPVKASNLRIVLK